MTEDTRRRLRAVRALAISLLLTVALVFGAELAARHLPLQRGQFSIPDRARCVRRSAVFGTEYLPNCATVNPIERTAFRTNSIGLRDEELRDDGAVRILSAGDSCTWGWAVAQNEAYPQVLQRRLDARFGAKAYRVINAGIPGSTTYDGLLYLRERGLALNPAIVIAGYAWNDSMPLGDIEEELRRQRLVLPLLELDDFLVTESSLWNWLRTKTRGSRPTHLPPRTTPEKLQRNVAEIVRLTRESGAQVLWLEFLDQQIENPYRDSLHTVQAELNVPALRYQGPQLDAVHPTREGYAQLAEDLLRRLEAEGYVGSH